MEKISKQLGEYQEQARKEIEQQKKLSQYLGDGEQEEEHDDKEEETKDQAKDLKEAAVKVNKANVNDESKTAGQGSKEQLNLIRQLKTQNEEQ